MKTQPEYSRFDVRAFAGHIAIALLVGGVIAYFTDARWLAAACWVSAAMYFNGSLAVHEDALPGGFDNPNGDDTPAFTNGFGATKYWLSTFAITGGLLAAGFACQTYL